MTQLYIYFDSFTEITREPSSDDWDRGDSHTTMYLSDVSLKNKGSRESFNTTEDVVVGDTVYVVWGNWGSGDTFGHDSGCFAEIFEVTKSAEKANRLSTTISTISTISTTSLNSFKFEGMVYHIPWNGYFDSFERMNVDTTQISA